VQTQKSKGAGEDDDQCCQTRDFGQHFWQCQAAISSMTLMNCEKRCNDNSTLEIGAFALSFVD
jgi:hypothetical protein